MGARLMTYTKILDAIEGVKTAAERRRQAEAGKTMPVAVGDVSVPLQVATEGRTTYRAEIVDEAAFIRAALSGSYGIPADCLTFNQAKVSEYARSMRQLIERWPGVRLVQTTKV